MYKEALIADDDLNCLNSVIRRYSGNQYNWKVKCANDGKSALQILAQEPIDLIISDLKMPQMDGLELLHYTRSYYPDLVRIVMSGMVDNFGTEELCSVSHQTHGKERALFDVDRMFNSLNWLDRLMLSPVMKNVIGQIPSMHYPSRQSTRQSYDTLIRSNRDLVNKLGFNAARLISSHQGDPKHSCEYQFNSQTENLTSVIVDTHLQHAEMTAHLAEVVAFDLTSSVSTAKQAFIHGFDHDLEELLLFLLYPLSYAGQVFGQARDSVSRLEVEKTLFGATHAEVGAYLACLWGWPQDLVFSIAFHYRPDQVQDHIPAPMHAVMVAESLIASKENPAWEPCICLQPLLDQHLFNSEDIKQWQSCSHLLN